MKWSFRLHRFFLTQNLKKDPKNCSPSLSMGVRTMRLMVHNQFTHFLTENWKFDIYKCVISLHFLLTARISRHTIIFESDKIMVPLLYILHLLTADILSVHYEYFYRIIQSFRYLTLGGRVNFAILVVGKKQSKVLKWVGTDRNVYTENKKMDFLSILCTWYLVHKHQLTSGVWSIFRIKIRRV